MRKIREKQEKRALEKKGETQKKTTSVKDFFDRK